MRFQKNILLKNYTTFKIGGPARYCCIVKNKTDLIEAIIFSKKARLPFFILGGGSNLLISDKGFNGLVIKLQTTNYKLQTTKIIAEAGVSLAKLVNTAANAGLSGLEWVSGIPGATLGGAVRGNAGAFDSEMKDIVMMVKALDARNLKIKNFNNKKCQFSYRSSIFKKNPNFIVLSCKLKLKKENKEKIKERTREILDHRKSHHPFNPSAGSIFKNFKHVRARDLIEKAGLKGKQIGEAQISQLHANFIVNCGGAKAKDVLKLINLAKKEVKNKFGIKLEEEIQKIS